ncbi:MAG TPA: DUF1365 domain-containing protein [Steroidobacteraceae bacterium]|nr:DUF1365 domain-containing protein [Steroidobacteraceae bacterium]
MNSALYIGRVNHCRLEPRRHEFNYASSLLWLDLAELPTVFEDRWLWSVERPNLGCYRREDYLGDPRLPLDEAVRDCVAAQAGRRPQGPIRLLTQLRLYGLGFNPVSFYYCYDARGERVEAIVAEITNTPWNQRHRYVVTASTDPPAGERAAGERLRSRFDKCFHVSPFMPMQMQYEWTFTEPGDELGIVMVNRRAERAVFSATLRLRRQPMTGPALAALLLNVPASGLGMLARIYWQALRLRLRGTPYFAPPAGGVPRGAADAAPPAADAGAQSSAL